MLSTRRTLPPLLIPILGLMALAALAACSSSGALRRASHRLPLEPCSVEGAEETLLCGTYSVYEDRESRQGRKIDLKIVVLPALGRHPEPDPIFYFAGGPGEGSTGAAPGFAAIHSDLREKRDIVLVDQRGSGGSNRLGCQAPGSPEDLQGYFNDYLSPEIVRQCRRELETRADLRLYTTSIGMDDVDEVRRWLGYQKINLVGGSYGTRAAQVYLRRHPEAVRTAVLEGMAGMNQLLPLYHARDAHRATDLMIEACAGDAACNAAFPELGRELREVLARLEAEPARAEIPHPAGGEPVEVRIDRDNFAENLRFMLYVPVVARAFPLAVHAAHGGDFTPFARVALLMQMELRGILAWGMNLSVTCAEDVAFFDQATAEEMTEGTYLGDFRVRLQLEACALWPRGEAAEGFHEPVRTEAPVLIINGHYDPVTPPRWADEAMPYLPNGLHVVVPQGHHGQFGLTNIGCYEGLIADFIDRGTTEGLDPSCVETMEREPFFTDPEELYAVLDAL